MELVMFDRNDPNEQGAQNRQAPFPSSQNTPGATSSPQQDNESGNGNQEGKQGLLPSISIPKGGGAIRGIDEKFAVNPATGAGSTGIPLPISRCGQTTLRYADGSVAH